MKGIPASNPPDGRDLMTLFLGPQIQAGPEEMLLRCGLAFRSQESVEICLEGCLPVVGRADLVLEVDDWEAVLLELDDRPPDADGPETGVARRRRALRQLLDARKKRCPEGLPATAFEVKSLNSYAFKHHRSAGELGNAYPHHKLQLYTCLRALGLFEGHLIYVARDTGWIEDVVIRPTETLEQAWLEDVARISAYYRDDRRPPLEPRTLDGKSNRHVTCSRYRDYLYTAGSQHGTFDL